MCIKTRVRPPAPPTAFTPKQFLSSLGRQADGILDASGSTVAMTADALGNYPVKLRVTDDTGRSYPSNSIGGQSDTAAAQAIVLAPTDPGCRCSDLAAGLQGKTVVFGWQQCRCGVMSCSYLIIECWKLNVEY
ncbi:MAG: hypothetical protein NTW21_12475 [Verrucomicrobia bacterium]|nr:hypothetical protein [Verrucomicrobiota bacterium]